MRCWKEHPTNHQLGCSFFTSSLKVVPVLAAELSHTHTEKTAGSLSFLLNVVAVVVVRIIKNNLILLVGLTSEIFVSYFRMSVMTGREKKTEGPSGGDVCWRRKRESDIKGKAEEMQQLPWLKNIRGHKHGKWETNNNSMKLKTTHGALSTPSLHPVPSSSFLPFYTILKRLKWVTKSNRKDTPYSTRCKYIQDSFFLFEKDSRFQAWKERCCFENFYLTFSCHKTLPSLLKGNTEYMKKICGFFRLSFDCNLYDRFRATFQQKKEVSNRLPVLECGLMLL